MEQLKLHSFGQNDHIESLKKKYESLKRKIIENENSNEVEKKEELKTLTTSFEKEKRESNHNLY